MLLMRAEVTQPSPLSKQPTVISNFDPKRSTSQPCNGDNQVCSTISSEKVIWIAGRSAPVVP